MPVEPENVAGLNVKLKDSYVGIAKGPHCHFPMYDRLYPRIDRRRRSPLKIRARTTKQWGSDTRRFMFFWINLSFLITTNIKLIKPVTLL